MLVVGTSGHAKEILDILDKQNRLKNLCFFDNVTIDLPAKLYGHFPIVKSEVEVEKFFFQDPNYILGVGGCSIRYKLALKMDALGGKLATVIANSANIGNYNVILGEGLNVMHDVLISNDVEIGKGTLLNAGCLIHHDVSVGSFCEISPGAKLTGRVRVGNFTSIGAGAIVLPRLRIGSNVVIGAGAVVTKDILVDNVVAVGAPAKIIKTIPPLIY